MVSSLPAQPALPAQLGPPMGPAQATRDGVAAGPPSGQTYQPPRQPEAGREGHSLARFWAPGPPVSHLPRMVSTVPLPRYL
jgi:hypothetical protein